MGDNKLTFYEFFAGGGMARAGLGDGWSCLFANDIDPIKAATYSENWGNDHLVCGDVANVELNDLQSTVDLAWASFPCQDLSLAGNHGGLGGAKDNLRTRSGTFWVFWSKIRALKKIGRHPRTIVLENVYGVLTSHGQRDFAAIGEAISSAGYRFGAIVIDAKIFVPQSRPRVFIVCIRDGLSIPKNLIARGPLVNWHPRALTLAQAFMADEVREKWVWWNLELPPLPVKKFDQVIEEQPLGVDWHSSEETSYILGLMSDVNLAKVMTAKRAGRRMIGGVYRRTRPDEQGVKRQRAEVRFDDVAGCLRTPAGGSSRQTIILVEGDNVRSRLLSPREAARLMGLPDDYKLPVRYNDAYHVCGDGVVVPVVRHLAANLLEPIVAANSREALVAAE